MRRMQHLQPEMKAIQQKYKQDKQRQQEEMMKFYRENDVNPLGSCLPLVAQLPVFISLFYMLRKNLRIDICQDVQTRFQAQYAAAHHIAATSSQALSQTTWCTYYPPHHYPSAAFLFINDITNTAHGATLVILLLLYVGTQVLSTMLMSAPTMDQNQRRLMMLMPLVFVIFVIRFPAGSDRVLDHHERVDDGSAVHVEAADGRASTAGRQCWVWWIERRRRRQRRSRRFEPRWRVWRVHRRRQ